MLEGNDLGHTTIKNGKAIAKGVAFRPLAETVKDTLAWWATAPEERRAKPRFIITPKSKPERFWIGKREVRLRAGA
jgi:2'-hydroxyisoflavone reductase